MPVAQLIGQVLANRYREDLERTGVGSGRHGFEFIPPAGLTFAPDAVDVRRSLDGVALEPANDACEMTFIGSARLNDRGIIHRAS